MPLPTSFSAMSPSRLMSPSLSRASSAKSRSWSSKGLVGGKIDVSHVTSRYKSGLAAPFRLSGKKTSLHANQIESSRQPQTRQIETSQHQQLGSNRESYSSANWDEDDLWQSPTLEMLGEHSASSHYATYDTPTSLLSGINDGFSGFRMNYYEGMDKNIESTPGDAYEAPPLDDGLPFDFDGGSNVRGSSVDSRKGISEPVAEASVSFHDCSADSNSYSLEKEHPKSQLTRPAAQQALFLASDKSMDDTEENGAKENQIENLHGIQSPEPPRVQSKTSSSPSPATSLAIPSAQTLYGSSLSGRFVLFQSTEILSDSLSVSRRALDEVEQCILPNLKCLFDHKGSIDLASRGQLKSMVVATSTVLLHTGLILSDTSYLCSSSLASNICDALSRRTCEEGTSTTMLLLNRLALLQAEFDKLSSKMEAMWSDKILLWDKLGRVKMNQPFSSVQLRDIVVKDLGQAQFALSQDLQRRATESTRPFLQNKSQATEAGTPTSSRSIKVGKIHLKQLRNGDIYKGHYSSGKKSGDGVYVFVNRDVYEGEFSADRLDGYGVYTFSHEGRYEGQWKAAVYSGHGTETFSKGSTYWGQYSAGLRNGCGACRFFNGDFYGGTWVNGLRDGLGMQQCVDESNYVGEYSRGKRQGVGIYSFPNGDCFQGQYHEDLPHGHGVYLFASGQMYEGEWSNGKKHGWSIYTVDNGQTFVGQWMDSKPRWIQQLEVQESATEESEPVSDEVLQIAREAQSRAQEVATKARGLADTYWSTRSKHVSTSIQSAIQASIRAAEARSRARRDLLDLTIAQNT